MGDPIKRFDEAMFGIYRRAKAEAGYNTSLYLQMLTRKGGLATAKDLINRGHPSDGYTHLFERGRLDLTVEAMIVEGAEWHTLFDEDELDRARKRLRAYGYNV